MNSRISRRVWKTALLACSIFAIFLLLVLDVLAQGIEFRNPINSRSLEDLVRAITTNVRSLAFVLAPLFILIAGFKFLTASFSGDTGGLGNAKKILYWTLVGTAVVVAASVIADAIINFAQGL